MHSDSFQLLPNSDPLCADDENDPPVLSAGDTLLCDDPVNGNDFTLSYIYEGTTGSTCTADWYAGTLPGDSANVPVSENTPGVYNYTVTCDGMESNEVSVTILDGDDAQCDETLYCTVSPYVGFPLPCPDVPCTGLDCDPTGNGGKPIIEEF